MEGGPPVKKGGKGQLVGRKKGKKGKKGHKKKAPSEAAGAQESVVVVGSHGGQNSTPVDCRRFDSNDDWTQYPSKAEAERQLNVRAAQIRECIAGTLEQVGGYEFRRPPDDDTGAHVAEEVPINLPKEKKVSKVLAKLAMLRPSSYK